MIGAFLEAIRATVQPCTFLLLAPTAVVVVVAGARWWSLVAANAAAVFGGWLLAANWWILDGGLLRLSGIVFAIVVTTIAGAAVVGRPDLLRRPVTLVPAVAAMSFLASLWWRPCVGNELGVILTEAQRDLSGELPGMTAYMLGAMWPLAAIVLARIAIAPVRRTSVAVLAASTSFAVVIGVALALGRHGDVVVTLTRWTQS